MKPITNISNISLPGVVSAIEATGIVVVNDGGVWLASDPIAADAIIASFDPTAHVKAEKTAELAHERWQKETGGFMFQPSGASRPYRFVSTRDAMGPVMGAVLAVQAGVFPDPTMWKTAEPGAVFVPITAADVVPMFKAFAAHVAAVFLDESIKQAETKVAVWQDVAAITIDVAAVEAVPAVEP